MIKCTWYPVDLLKRDLWQSKLSSSNMQKALPAAPTISLAQAAGGFGARDEPLFEWRIATHANSLMWFRLDFLAWPLRDQWAPVWGAKAIYLRAVTPQTAATAHHHHRQWHDFITHRNPELDISTELTLQIELLSAR